MFTIYVKFECYEGKREAFVRRVREQGILDAIRSEDGCHRYDYYFSEENKNELLLLEAWETKHHQEVHMTQPHMEVLRSLNAEHIVSATLGEYEVK
ncbi:MAG: antibiotic biosynthesis monooxygenase [Clostridia bacterium]|nr:antibiotic biosynthesis monooxygenase [Clostridia bacterium]